MTFQIDVSNKGSVKIKLENEGVMSPEELSALLSELNTARATAIQNKSSYIEKVDPKDPRLQEYAEMMDYLLQMFSYLNVGIGANETPTFIGNGLVKETYRRCTGDLNRFITEKNYLVGEIMQWYMMLGVPMKSFREQFDYFLRNKLDPWKTRWNDQFTQKQ